MLSGYKTYLAAAGLFLFAVSGLYTGNLSAVEAWPLILQAAAIAGLRSGVAKSAH